MSCTTLTIECFKAAYTANVGYDSLFCGLKVTCDSNVKYIRAPYVADFNGNTLMLHGWDKSETVIDDVTVTGLSVAQVKDLVATCCCGDDQHLIVNNTPVGYIPTTSGNTSNLNEVVIDSGGDTWIIDINGDARKFNKGTVTSVGLSASGALSVTGSPVTGSGVMTLNWTGTTSQYVRGDGTLATMPVVQWSDSLVAFGRTSVGGLTYDSYFKYHYTEHALTIGTRAAGTVGVYGLLIGTNNLSTLDISLIVGTNCTNNEYYSLIVGNNIVNNGRYSLNVGYNQTNTSAGEYSVIVGTGNSNVFKRSLIIGSSITSTGSGSESIIGGSTHTLTAIAYGIISGYGHNLNESYYSFIAGRENIVTSAHGVNVLGRKGEAIHDGVTMLLDYTGAVISSTASHQLTARFTNGYRFMVSASSRAMGISSSRVVTIDNLSGAGTRMVVANASGELSTQTIPSGTVTSVGASVTASTALTVSGSPITTSGVLAFSWTGTTSQYVRGNGTLDTFPTIPVVNDNTITLSAGTGLIGGGAFTLNQASNDTITFTLNAGLNDLTDVVLSSPSNGQIIQYNGTNWVNVTPTWTSNTGTVTSVALALPSDTFTISGSPVTTSGTLTGTYKSQTKKFVLAAPWGVDGTPFWRQLHPSDLQQSGATTGQVIMWDGTAWNPASGGSGTVTSFSAGNLSPLFTTNVATPTTTPALSFNLSNCNQYQVFGRVVAGTGAPSYVTLNPIAFNGLAIPSGELVYGTGTSVTSLNKYRVVAGEGIVSGDGIGVAYFGMYAGNGVNEGGALRIKRGSNFVTYIGSDSAAFGGNNNNTTIFAYGNNSVNIATNSVRRLIVDGNGYVTINNIPTAASATDILVSNGGVVSTRTVASLGIGGSAVWYIQGTATDATTNSQDIVRTGRVRIGASGSSSYMLSVVGDAYITTGTIVNNNQAYKGYSTAVSPVNLIKINSSNYVEVGQSSYDIYLANYTSGRSADTKVSTDKYMYVNASGLVKLDSDQNIRNVIGWISKTTNTGVTAGGGPTKISGSTVQQTAGGPYTTVSGNLTIPAQDRYHLITVTVQFVTTSGVAATPNITFDVYNGSGVVQDSTYIVNHDVINDTKEYSFVLQGTTAGVTSIYVRATATVAGITVQKCHMKAMDMGPV